MKTKIILSLLLLAAALQQTSAQKSTIALSFENVFGAEPLTFGKEYENVHGEKLKFSLLNYFITNIELVRADGGTYKVPTENSYFLVKQSDPASQKISLPVPSGKYASIRFMIGVDSLRNTMKADQRQGVLDVGARARGMYWSWNSGYIFFKMEGKSPSSPDSLKNGFYYHIGGYGGFDSKTLNNIRFKTIAFDKAVKVSSRKETDVVVTVDAKRFFHEKNLLKVSEHPSIMWGPVSTQIADNYVNIFTLKEVRYSKRAK
jgi:hypothetical protein